MKLHIILEDVAPQPYLKITSFNMNIQPYLKLVGKHKMIHNYELKAASKLVENKIAFNGRPDELHTGVVGISKNHSSEKIKSFNKEKERKEVGKNIPLNLGKSFENYIIDLCKNIPGFKDNTKNTKVVDFS